MNCQWHAFLTLLPHWMRQDVDRLGKETLQELRIRIGQVPELHLQSGAYRLTRKVERSDINFIINTASEYSPWAAGTTAEGFLTAAGGHRIGICGVGTVQDRAFTGIHYPTSLCMRVARDFEGIASRADGITGSILIIGPPGSGKTTLLRDLIRRKSSVGQGSVVVIDEREEIFPLYHGQACFLAGNRTDIMSRCPKAVGIDAAIRNMNPEWIAVDEITAQTDCDAMLHAGWCGVKLLATAHAASLADLRTRPVYQTIVAYKLFSHILLLRKDKTWTLERI